MQTNDNLLWETARCRASFKKSLFSYVVVSAFLWAVWLMSGTHSWPPAHPGNYFWYMPWPAWVMFWWGIGLFCKFGKAYLFNAHTSVEEEYERLKTQENQSKNTSSNSHL